MLFEADGTRAIQPLNPYQGPWYTKPVNEAVKGDTIDINSTIWQLANEQTTLTLLPMS